MRKAVLGFTLAALVGTLAVKAPEYAVERLVSKSYRIHDGSITMCLAAALSADARLMTRAERAAIDEHLYAAIGALERDEAYFRLYAPDGDVARGVTWRNWRAAMRGFDATIENGGEAVDHLQRAVELLSPQDPSA